MSAISGYINQIQNAVYGEQVRSSIVNALLACYSDVENPDLQSAAFQAAIEAAYQDGILDIIEVTQVSQMTNENIIYRYMGTQAGYTANTLYYHNGTAWVPIGSGLLTASTAAQMTNTDAIYKYTGNETGYIANVLYYYNGTEWTTISDPQITEELNEIKTGYLKIGPSVLTDVQKEQTRASIGAVAADEVFSTAAKNALIELLQKVAYIDTSGQDYIDDLAEALGVDGSTPSADTDGDLGFLPLSNIISGKYIGTDGSIVTSTYETTRYCEDYYQINPLAQTFISINGSSQAFGIAEYDEQYNFIKNSTFTSAPWIASQYIFDSSTKYIRFWWSFSNISTPEISVAVKGTPLSFEIGDINATTGAAATANYRIRTGRVSVNEELITVIGCPFAKTWDDWSQYSGYAMRCFQDPSTYLGNVGDTSTGDSSRPFFDADITDKSLLTGTDYVRFVMVYDNKHSAPMATYVDVKANITINGVKYWLVLSS